MGSNLIHATSHFDIATAAWLARSAEIAYDDPAIIERTLTQAWNYSRFRFIDIEGTQCFIGAGSDSVLVSFRGTQTASLEDWLTDLDFDLIPGPLGGHVHAGFYDGLRCIWHVLDQEVRQMLAQRGRRLWVTGHSLGAALAALAVARWRDAGLLPGGLYAFGQPRVGDQQFARAFDFAFRSHTFRVVNHHDIVTRTPPRIGGYRHLGTFIYFTEDGQLATDLGWWDRFLNRWHGTIDTILDWGKGGIADHSMTRYRQLMDNLSRHPSSTDTIPLPKTSFVEKNTIRPLLVVPRRRAA